MHNKWLVCVSLLPPPLSLATLSHHITPSPLTHKISVCTRLLPIFYGLLTLSFHHPFDLIHPTTVAENKAELINPNSKAFSEALAKTNHQWQYAHSATTLKKDTENVAQIAGYGKQMTNKLASETSQFKTKNIIEALRTRFQNEEETSVDFEKLGNVAASYLRRAPSCGFMNGAIGDVQMRERKARQARRQKVVEKEGGAEIVNPEREEKTATDQRVAAALSCLEEVSEQGPVSLFHFVLNPKSFTQTVENIFDVSFLVNKGNAALTFHNNIPYIQKSAPPGSSDEAQKVQNWQQFVCKLDVGRYYQLIEAFQIDKCFLPHRKIEKH
jgi:non-structural maintenance of chromosomes element 4